ncbi:MAG: 2-dehydro-3-deoxy-6-phosphogalactonate aldolase [Oceanospirillaceae bacterium]|nr:2-dehydro-3-deoxy-6-phosphogalactonate aldolase [Oceanospirillaceae bacterium]
MSSRQLIAILRGIEPVQALEIAEVIINAGITKIEVPMNSPDAIQSIKLMVEKFGDNAEFGAGTVLNVAQVDAVAAVGGKLIVSPNCNTQVIRRTKELGLQSFPGVLTPTEAFSAIDAGADGLKFFPASILGPSGVAAMKAVLPKDMPTFAVGGANADNFEQWLAAGIDGFGIGSAIFKPGFSAQQVKDVAELMVAAYDKAKGL